MNPSLNYFQICFVRDNYRTMSQRDIAAHIHTPVSHVAFLMKEYGWVVTKAEADQKKAAKNSKRTSLTSDQDYYILANYLSVPVKTIARNLDKSQTCIRTRLRQLELIIPAEIIQQRKLDSQRKKGHTPFNKGMKQRDYMSDEAIDRTAKGRFKKGNRPHNTYPENGEIRIRADQSGKSYKWIRIEEGKWVQLQRFLWEKKNGPIPPKMCLWAKDGDPLNEDPDNWEPISRKENIQRNSGSKELSDGYVLGCMVHKNPELKKIIREEYSELIELKRNQLLLTRKIKSHESKNNHQ